MDKILHILYLSGTNFTVHNGAIKVNNTSIEANLYSQYKLNIINEHHIIIDKRYIVDIWGGDLYLNIVMPHTVLQIRINDGGDDYNSEGTPHIS